MKITPLELRQYTFEKTFRGYNIEEVDMFINNLSQEWERILNESKMLRMQLEIAEKEAAKLREMELTLFKTLKTAEDTSTMITEQANQQAERNLLEANSKAEKMVSDAQLSAERIVSEANQHAFEIIQSAENKSNYIKEDVLSEVKAMERDFKAMQQYKDNLMTQLRGLATTTIEHVERFENKFDIEAIENKIDKANQTIINDINSSKNVVETEIESNENEFVEAPIESIVEEKEIPFEVVTTLDEPTITEEEISETQTEEWIEEPIEAAKEEIIEVNDLLEDELVEEEIIENEIPTDELTTVISHDQLEEIEVVSDSLEVEEIEEPTVEDIKEKSFFDRIEAIKESIAIREEDEEPKLPIYEPPQMTVISSSVNAMANSDTQEEPKTEPIAVKPPKQDDLTLIEGIGPKVKEVLNQHNILTFRDLAITPIYRIHQFLENAGGNFNLIDPSTWTEQALLAAEGRWDELKERQDELVGGRIVKQEEIVVEKVEEIPVAKPTNLDDITEEMLEKVNKVKNAIRKAMTDKPEGNVKEDGYIPTLNDVLNKNRKSGGSFFDNVG